MSSDVVELSKYLSTVMGMLKERHQGCKFTLMASFEDPKLQIDGEPTVSVAMVSNEGSLDVIIDRMQQIQQRLEDKQEPPLQ